MRRYLNLLRVFLREDGGPTATEYAIMLALIALVAVATVRGIGESMQAIYVAINGVMPT